jgi:membrane associated rhomboid family serine protease
VGRIPSSPGIGYTFGPGPLTPAVKALVYSNIAVFVVMLVVPSLITWIGLIPELVLTRAYIWQLVTYQFVHTQPFHLLLNMLTVWMFGVDLERRWGTVAFTKYYLIVGTTAGVATVLVSMLPMAWAQMSYSAVTIGASGAGYGLLMAWGIVFPHRTVHLLGIFPLTARVFVLIIGAISLSQAISSGGNSGIAHVAHLGGLVAGWLYLKTPSPRTPPPPPRRPDYIRRVH